MMASLDLHPESRNLSCAWAEAFLRVIEPGVTELMPLTVTVADLADGVAKEEDKIRIRLDRELLAQGFQDCHTVANAIFPDSLRDPAGGAEKLFARYERIWPRIKRHHSNRRGTYFRRLTAYGARGSSKGVNQLRHIIETYKRGNHRRSALQGAIFDPSQDHTHSRRQGFPCLQQVSFLPCSGNGLTVVGFYATQYLFERAYGNFLGLCRLGRFMAGEMGLTLVQMTSIAAVAQLGNVSKGAVEDFAENLRKLLAERG